MNFRIGESIKLRTVNLNAHQSDCESGNYGADMHGPHIWCFPLLNIDQTLTRVCSFAQTIPDFLTSIADSGTAHQDCSSRVEGPHKCSIGCCSKGACCLWRNYRIKGVWYVVNLPGIYCLNVVTNMLDYTDPSWMTALHKLFDKLCPDAWLCYGLVHNHHHLLFEWIYYNCFRY